jgi:type I restriction enzyme S subunit
LVKGTSPTLKTEPGPYPLVVTADYRRSSATYQFEEPAVCVPLVSSTGHGDAALHRVHYEEGKYAVANLLVALVPKDRLECHPKYLYHLLTAKKDSLLVPLMQGTANVSLKVDDIASVKIQLPPIDEQRRIVQRIESIASQVGKVRRIQVEIESDLNALLMSAYHQITDGAPTKPLCEIAPLTRRPVIVDPEKTYPQVAVRSFGRGTFHKDPLIGLEVTWQKPYLVKEGDILISNIKAWEGAIAVATADDDGYVGSHRYLTCLPIPKIATARFVCFHLLTPEGLLHVGEASPGSADRNRTLSTTALAQIPIPLPSYENQLWFEEQCHRFDSVKALRVETENELKIIVSALLSQYFRA